LWTHPEDSLNGGKTYHKASTYNYTTKVIISFHSVQQMLLYVARVCKLTPYNVFLHKKIGHFSLFGWNFLPSWFETRYPR